MSEHDHRSNRSQRRAGEVRQKLARHVESLRRQGVSPHDALDSMAHWVARIMEEQAAQPANPEYPASGHSHPSEEPNVWMADLRAIPPRLSLSAVSVLYHLRQRTCYPAELGERLGVSAAAITGTIDTLEQRGYLTRQRDAADRRKVVLKLTEQGKEVAGRIFSFG